ncbi:NAD(P) transhydrogenase subunit alpha [Rhodobacteraceae bacterium KMM 6894]|nr:NAD(P) transhydrogenase subunit alpha [Rhodobacteraceae bacterium KMM 6894]
MPIKIAVLKETQPGEQRIAMVPSVVEQLEKLGAEFVIQSGAGDAVKLPDASFPTAKFEADVSKVVGDADIVLCVQAPRMAVVQKMKPSAILISFIYENKQPKLVAALRKKGIICFAMERVPRISRAQAMDALTSQATLSGYYGALLGATHLARIFPRMTTAVGTLHPAKVLVMGLGVAGLQAIATAHRLGAVVEGYDVRPETKGEAASLGAKFVDTGVDATGEGGYARELTKDEKDKVAQVVTKHIQQADVVITTANVPGRPAPKLISKAQVDGMKAGSVIVDLAADGGGNCAYTEAGKTTQVGQVTIVAPINVPSLLGEHASELYAKNILNLLKLLIVDGKLAPDWSDEVIAKTALTGAPEVTPEQAKPALEAVNSGAKQ